MTKQSDLDNIQGFWSAFLRPAKSTPVGPRYIVFSLRIRFAEVKNLSLNDKQWKNNPSYMADG